MTQTAYKQAGNTASETGLHFAPSLEDVIVAETTLSHVDGLAGELTIRGRHIDDLAGHMRFEDLATMLWSGFLSHPATNIVSALAVSRHHAFDAMQPLLPLANKLEVIEWMRACLDAMPIQKDIDEAIQITAALSVFLAAAHRVKHGFDPVEPNANLGFAEDLLSMLHDDTPDPSASVALDRYLVTIADHGLNASTFTARVIASTQSDMRSAISGAIGALKGPLHGGAPGPVLDMVEAIGTPDNADAWIAKELAKGNRLMGFGHRIYRVRDPRADILKSGLQILGETSPKVTHAREIEAAALAALKKHKPERALETNVEFYTAILLDAVGFDRTLFTPLFAVGRTAGWTAHVMEQRAVNKLIRPQSTYVGPTPD